MMKKLVRRTLNSIGYDVKKLGHPPYQSRPDPTGVCSLTDLSLHQEKTAEIRGMVSDESCTILYSICYLQELEGDVAEIGSWQGKSTSFLAQAVEDSGNGRLHAIDHFKGNMGKTSLYVVNRDDLSDLEAGFRENMDRLGLTETIHLHNATTSEAAREIEDRSLRFLFIDGDHTPEGVRLDLETFWPKLLPGAILVFDDYSTQFPGVVDLVQRLCQGVRPSRAYAYHNTFVITLPTTRLPQHLPLG